MQINYEYALDKVRQIGLNGKILDYGCGSGDVVLAGRESGLNIVGVDAFYDGSNAKKEVISHGLLGTSVFSLKKDFSIPFSDGMFDFVISNQVMEHVDDLDFTLKEIARVLKPSGELLTLFPAIEVIREGHCGIPFAHWFSSHSKWRYPYMRLMRGIGLGYFKETKSQHEWVLNFMDWLDKYTVYRSYTNISQSFARNSFAIKHYEVDYINYRLLNKGIYLPGFLKKSASWRVFASIYCRLMGGLVILARKVKDEE